MTGIRFWTNEEITRKMLTDLGAIFSDRRIADIEIDNKFFAAPMTAREIKSKILANIDAAETAAMARFPHAANLSPMQKKIVAILSRGGGYSIAELRAAFGCASADTHAIETAIYNLRQEMGREFIKHENGLYKL